MLPGMSGEDDDGDGDDGDDDGEATMLLGMSGQPLEN